MAHWFHRNPLKPAKPAKFELKSVPTSDAAKRLCNELRLRRQKLLEHLESASTDYDIVWGEFQQYLALLYGFVFEVAEAASPQVQQQQQQNGFALPTANSRDEEEGEGEEGSRRKNSKLRYLVKFTWGMSMLGGDAIALVDTWYEVLNICFNMALWITKRAAWLSGRDEVRESDAKNIHTALRRAAGIFQYIMKHSDKLSGLYAFNGNDFDLSVLQAYHTQCIAEAQEVAIARAIELKHSPTLISSLANETAAKYQLCDKYVEKFAEKQPERFEKWRRYFQLKHRFYLAYAYAYLGESLLASDKCGEAIRACREGCSNYELAKSMCDKYAQARGPGFVAKPEQHLFFRRVEPLLQRHLEKAQRENGFIYHQKVPDDCPVLQEEKASFGVARPELFVYPKKAEEWTCVCYNAFDISKAFMPEFKPAQQVTKSLSPVKEEKVYETDKDPNNLSGCSIQ